MGLFHKDISNLDDLFFHQLKDIYYAEQQITKALPKMMEKVTEPQLRLSFQAHLGETENHVRRLDEIFRMRSQTPKAVDCPAIDGIIKEANEIASDTADKDTLDTALLASAQAVEHYEIARYGALIAWAKRLGRPDCAALLQKTLDEEKATDQKLTALADAKVNKKAA